MAAVIPGRTFTAKAGAALTAYLYHWVKFSAYMTVIPCAAATDKPCGVLVEIGASGDNVLVCWDGDVKLMAGTALTLDWLVGTDANAKGARMVSGTDTTKFVCGTVIKATTKADVYAEVRINCATAYLAR